MPQGYYEVGSGEHYDDQTINSINVLILPGGRAANTTINTWGELHLYSNTIANGVTINSGGSLIDNFSATASSVRINSGGRAFISSGGLVDNTTIHSGGRLDVISGGTATGIDVLTGGSLWLEVAPDAYARGTINGSTFELGGGVISNYAVQSGCGLDVYIGGLAENTTVSSGGKIRIDSGGLVNNVTLDPGGRLEIYPDGTATRIKENGGYIYTLTGSEVMTFIPNSFSGLTLNHGFATVHSGTTATDMTVCSSGIIEVYSSGSANGVQLDDGGRLWIGSGGMAGGVTVNSGGSLRILSNGTANDVAIKSGGTLFVSSGGMANDVTIKSGGELFISRGGGKLTGKMTFEKGVIVSSAVSAIIDFDLTQTTAGAAALVNELSVIPDTFLFTLTVDGTQTNGTYNLASGAARFNGTISVVNTSGTALGTLMIGETSNIGGASYMLNLSNDYHLTVTISGAEPPPPPTPTYVAKSDIDGNGMSDVMFVWTGEHGEGNFQHGYWMNGTSEWQSANCGHPASWDNLGNYDMTGDGKADSVMFGNVDAYEVPSAYIGFYQDGIDTDENWVTIGFLSNAAGIAWQNKVGNMTGNASGVNSIAWYAPELGSVGVWTDGTENWVQLNGAFMEGWTLAGIGDFDGDGKDTVVMSYNGGQFLYTVGIGDEAPTSLGSANWSGWELRAIGDFSGDGKDDIILFHKEFGAMAMLVDGNSDNYQSIGQLDAKDWFVVGCGDYNGDKMDDLLVRQYSTGMLGYYVSADQSQWVELGHGVDMQWTVIA